MFESRLQLAQIWLAMSAVLAVVAVAGFAFGSLIVATFCLLLSHGFAATGCFFYMDSKGYPGMLGVSLGVGIGVMGSILVLFLPDQSEEAPFDL